MNFVHQLRLPDGIPFQMHLDGTQAQDNLQVYLHLHRNQVFHQVWMGQSSPKDRCLQDHLHHNLQLTTQGLVQAHFHQHHLNLQLHLMAQERCLWLYILHNLLQ